MIIIYKDLLFKSSNVKSTHVRVDAEVELDKDVLQPIRQSGTSYRPLTFLLLTDQQRTHPLQASRPTWVA